MARSKYKLPFVARPLFFSCIRKNYQRSKLKKNYLRKFILLKDKKKISKISLNFFFFNRASLFSSDLLDRYVAVHNGKFFLLVNMLNDTIGYRLGEFSRSRRIVKHKFKKKRVKKVIKKKYI